MPLQKRNELVELIAKRTFRNNAWHTFFASPREAVREALKAKSVKAAFKGKNESMAILRGNWRDRILFGEITGEEGDWRSKAAHEAVHFLQVKKAIRTPRTPGADTSEHLSTAAGIFAGYLKVRRENPPISAEALERVAEADRPRLQRFATAFRNQAIARVVNAYGIQTALFHHATSDAPLPRSRALTQRSYEVGAEYGKKAVELSEKHNPEVGEHFLYLLSQGHSTEAAEEAAVRIKARRLP